MEDRFVDFVMTLKAQLDEGQNFVFVRQRRTAACAQTRAIGRKFEKLEAAGFHVPQMLRLGLGP
jgi:hypothetical protein